MARPRGSEPLFASYNIHKCVGVDGRFDPGRIATVIGEIGADVMAIQEADKRFGDREGLLDLEAIERDTGLVPVPVDNSHNGHGWHGNLLLVREAMVGGAQQINLPGHEPRGALVVDVDLPHGPVRVVAAHLGLLRQARLSQVATLVSVARQDTDHPIVLMGDFNEWRRRGRSALQGLAPGFGPVESGVPSFPAYFPVLPLDRIVARPHALLGPMSVHDTALARRASDHLPVKARMRVAARAAATEDADLQARAR